MASKPLRFWVVLLTTIGLSFCASASEADIKIPDLTAVKFPGLGGFTGPQLMNIGLLICLVGAAFGIVQYAQTKNLPVHSRMA